MGGGGGMGTLQALLTELSGLKKPRGFFNRVVRRTLGMRPKPPPRYRMLVMMATNMPQALDEALLRPGRIDRIYRVGYPSKEGRKKTYQGYFDKVQHELTDADIDKLAVITPYATGATIKDLVNEALIVAIRDGREVITWKDVLKAKLLKSLGPPEDVEYIERERHAIAVHEACHAVVAYRVRKHLTIDISTIEKGQSYLGMVSSIPLEEQFTQWRSEYDADLMVSLASLAGERMFFGGDSSSGVSGDLTQATALATYMEGYWGMGEHIGSQQFMKSTPQMVTADATSDMFETELGRRVETRLQEVYGYTQEMLAAERSTVLGVAHALETFKTLTGDDVEAVIEGRLGPLVDGTPYRSPEFIEELEAYHRVAVDAHRMHGKVEVALPALNGHGQLGLPLPMPEAVHFEPPS
jgi:cell division protease FtsH